MIKNNIAIVGAGQLGSRHLQALAILPNNHSIYVVDTSSESLNMSRERWLECGNSGIEVFFLDSVTKLPPKINVSIIATNSKVRLQVIESLLEVCDVDFLILEKFLFPAIDQYKKCSNLLQKSKTAAWVNCPRRMFPDYARLKNHFTSQDADTYKFTVTGGLWGLGCNSIHFVDLLTWMFDDAISSIDTTRLDQVIHTSKRESYIEFSGTLSGSTTSGNTFKLVDTNQNEDPIRIFFDSSSAGRIEIFENKNKIVFAPNQDTMTPHTQPLQTFFQSHLSHLFVTSLIQSGTCDLTPFSHSKELHTTLLEGFLTHYQKITNQSENLCPIT